MKIGKKRSHYYIVDDQSDPADESCASKEKTSAQPMSFGEFIKYLEEVVYNDNASMIIYQSLEEGNERPITYTDDVELGSDIYPQLKPFYQVMITYLVDWVNGLDELPDQEEFFQCVARFVALYQLHIRDFCYHPLYSMKVLLYGKVPSHKFALSADRARDQGWEIASFCKVGWCCA